MVPRGTLPGPILAVSNQKGGVGKTTTVVNVASYAALAGRRVLVVDVDPQGNTSSVLAPQAQPGSIFSGGTPIPAADEGVQVITAGLALVDDERRLSRQDGSRSLLRRLLEPYRHQFDVICIDCPPTLSWFSSNALIAADHLLLPVQAEYYSLEGLAQLLAYVDDLRQDGGARVQVLGVLLTMVDPRHPQAFHVEQDLRQHFSDLVFSEVIPRDPTLAAAPSHAASILRYDPLSPGGLAYAAITRQVLQRLAAASST
jgi:chromosome partitioning protein